MQHIQSVCQFFSLLVYMMFFSDFSFLRKFCKSFVSWGGGDGQLWSQWSLVNACMTISLFIRWNLLKPTYTHFYFCSTQICSGRRQVQHCSLIQIASFGFVFRRRSFFVCCPSVTLNNLAIG